MNKKRLLRNLAEETYCRLGVSAIHGVGVIAIRSIPRGINPFKGSKKYREIVVHWDELRALPRGIGKMIDIFCYAEGDRVLVPECGLNGLDMPFYVNHSPQPNVAYDKDGVFKTIRAVRVGEELTFDYDAAFGGKHAF